MTDLTLALSPLTKLKLLLAPLSALGFAYWIVFVRAPNLAPSMKLLFFAPWLIALAVIVSTWNRRYVFTRKTVRVRLFFRWRETPLPQRILIRRANRPRRTVAVLDPESSGEVVSVSLQLIPEAAEALVKFYQQWQPDLSLDDGAA